MQKEEYKYIRNLAWDLLIDAQISSLPVSIQSIAKLYNLENEIDLSKTRYENCLKLSYYILNFFGFENNPQNCKMLSMRIMCPLIVLKAINIKDENELFQLTDLPYKLAVQRFERYKMLLNRNKFELSNLESKVLTNFQSWISSRLNTHD